MTPESDRVSIGPKLSVAGSNPKPLPNPEPLSERVRSLRLPAHATNRPRTNWFPWVLCLALIGLVGWLGSHQFNEPPAVEVAPTTAQQQPVTPTSSAVRAAESEVVLESKGYVIPAHQILVTPQVSGRIEILNIEEGRRVKKGDILAEIEKTDFLADQARADALLAAAKQKLLELERGNRPEEIKQVEAELAETETNLKQLYSDWQRSIKLHASHTITDREYELSESQYRVMDYRVAKLKQALKLIKDGPRIERIDLARADVKQAEADVVKAKWRLDNCTIRAPISGTILKKNAEEGNIVNPIAFNGSFSLCEMADLADLEVDLAIQERDIARTFPGQRCKVRAEAFPERIYEGVVSRLMPIADRAKGAIPVRVKLSVPAEEEGLYLKPEMGAVVSFLRKEPAPGQASSREASR